MSETDPNAKEFRLKALEASVQLNAFRYTQMNADKKEFRRILEDAVAIEHYLLTGSLSPDLPK